MRLNTAKDEKISSRSMFWLMGAGRVRDRGKDSVIGS